MNILSVGNFTNGWDGSICDEEHIAAALEKLGHEVTRWQREDVAEQAKQFTSIGDTTIDVDFVLIAQWDGYPSFDWLKVPKVYWAFDYQAAGQPWHERLIEECDLYLSKRIEDCRYKNWQWLAQDFAPDFIDKHSKADLIEKDIDILFTGSYLSWADERNKIVKSISELYGQRFVVHSVNDWPFLERQAPIMDEGLPDLYARAKIVLAVDHTIEAGYWSDRAAQAMCCGAFVLHRYVPLLEVALHNNVEYFKSVGDCLGQIDYFLAQPEHREVVANNGYKYAQANLKVRNRVRDLLTIVESVL